MEREARSAEEEEQEPAALLAPRSSLSRPTSLLSASSSLLRAPRSLLAALCIAVLWFVLCRALSSEWAINEQYSYGWFVPFFAGYLFWLRYEDRPLPRDGSSSLRVPSSKLLAPGSASFSASAFQLFSFWTVSFLSLLLLLPVRLFEVGNPDWRPLGWIHAAIVVSLTLLLTWRVGGRAWLKHFAFPICFIFVAVPWVSPIETPIIQGLMRGVAAVAAETLNLLGVPAQLEGNLIRVSTGLVGVNEACSGVRSLQTSIMIGLLFGELKRLSISRRIVLLGSAVLIALVANCARALFLVSLAARQSGSVHQWHDIAGYSIVVAVFLGTLGVASLLSPHKVETRSSKVEVESAANPQSAIRIPQSKFLPSTFYLLPCFAWLVLVETGVESWYRIHERALTHEPSWTVKWPENTPGFRNIEIDEGVKRTLRFDRGREVAWPLTNSEQPTAPSRANASVVAYFFRWNPGGSSVLRARAHRPDICLPDAGWTKLNDRGEADFPVDGVKLPFRRVNFRKGNGAAVAHTYFCLQEDALHLQEERPDLLPFTGTQPDWSFPARWRVVREGIRNLGQQVLEVAIFAPADLPPDEVDRTFSYVLNEVIVSAKSR